MFQRTWSPRIASASGVPGRERPGATATAETEGSSEEEDRVEARDATGSGLEDPVKLTDRNHASG
jgi:hypothetical protein